MSNFVEHSRGKGPIVAHYEGGTMYVTHLDRPAIFQFIEDTTGHDHPDLVAAVDTWDMHGLPESICVKAEAALCGMNGTEAEAFIVYVLREGFVPDLDAWNEATIWIDPEDEELVSAWLADNVGMLSADSEALLADYLDTERVVHDFFLADHVHAYSPSGTLYLYETP